MCLCEGQNIALEHGTLFTIQQQVCSHGDRSEENAQTDERPCVPFLFAQAQHEPSLYASCVHNGSGTFPSQSLIFIYINPWCAELALVDSLVGEPGLALWISSIEKLISQNSLLRCSSLLQNGQLVVWLWAKAWLLSNCYTTKPIIKLTTYCDIVVFL